MAVDELLGKEEVVVKRLGEFLEGMGPFAGASIDGEGRVILLLDPARLLTAGADAIRAAGRPVADTTAPALSRGGRQRIARGRLRERSEVRSADARAGRLQRDDGPRRRRGLAPARRARVDVIVTDLEMPASTDTS